MGSLYITTLLGCHIQEALFEVEKGVILIEKYYEICVGKLKGK